MGRVFFNTRQNTQELNSSFSTYQALASDSGKTFLLNSASAMTITLPADADINIGWHCRFLMILDNNNAYTIKCSDVTDSTGQMFVGGVNYQVIADATANVFQGYAATAANDSQIDLDTNLDDNQAKAGSFVDIVKTASNRFMVTGHVASADADGTGAAIFSNAS
tara:strand:- start:917 stop:1411 length:495 start_codon:yes stop_codon:yes gene_type:complete